MNPGLVVKLRPTGPWRIGPDSGARNRVDSIYHSDTLYAAVTGALGRLGPLEDWLAATARSQAPEVCFSSCFPFLDEIGFIVPPRTIWPPTSPALLSARLRWKSARFVPLGIVQAMLSGRTLNENDWSVDAASECLLPAGRLGPFRTGMRSNAAVDRLSGSAERHSTACIEFRAGAGLWTVISFADDAAAARWLEPVKTAFRLLADSGFGGERSRGWGRSEMPEFIHGELPEMILPAIVAEALKEEEPPAPEPAPPIEEPPAAEPPVEEPPPEPEPEPSPDEPLPQEAAAPAPAAELPEPDPEPNPNEPPPQEAAVLAPADIVPLEGPEPELAPIASEPQPQEAAVLAPVDIVPPEPAPETEPAPSPSEPQPQEAAVLAPTDIVPLEAPEPEPEPSPSEPPPQEAAVLAPANIVPLEAPEPEPEPSPSEPPPQEAAVLASAAELPVPEPQAAISPIPDPEPHLPPPDPEPNPEPAPPIPEPAPEPNPDLPSPDPEPSPEPAPAPPDPVIPEPELPGIVPEPAPAFADQSRDRKGAVAPPVPEPQPLPDGRGSDAATNPHWLLSLYTPAASDSVDWGRGSYSVIARGGRIESNIRSGELKKQLPMIAEGSVLYASAAPCGSAPDVAPDGFAHPVYRAGFALSIPLPEAH